MAASENPPPNAPFHTYGTRVFHTYGTRVFHTYGTRRRVPYLWNATSRKPNHRVFMLMCPYIANTPLTKMHTRK